MISEWILQDKINTAITGKADKHEISTLNLNVDRLEHSNRELRAEVNELRAWLERLQEKIMEMEKP